MANNRRASRIQLTLYLEDVSRPSSLPLWIPTFVGMTDALRRASTRRDSQNTPGNSRYFTRCLYSFHFSTPYFASHTLSSSN